MNLPMGWKKAEPTGIGSDIGTPEEKWKDVAHPRHPRQEIRRWVRGNRYVRVCLEETEEGERFALHYGWLDDEDQDDFHMTNTELNPLIRDAMQLMAKGGY